MLCVDAHPVDFGTSNCTGMVSPWKHLVILVSDWNPPWSADVRTCHAPKLGPPLWKALYILLDSCRVFMVL
jgi:hypothetical protein